ncbi:tetratricopeptide repeat protein [Peribacillus simplex]|uniref:tetratricopeptide repeat protein n=1 Tax=Peribacillus simplex TaxID=1478 RepID=UPI0037FB9222
MLKTIKYLIASLLIFISILLYLKLLDNDNKSEISDNQARNELKETVNNIEEYIVEHPDDLTALDEAVYLQYVLGNYNEAIDLGLELIDKDPENYMSYFRMANIKTKIEEWDEMIHYMEKAHDIEKSSHMLYYLSTSYIVKDANHALELLNKLDNYQMGSEGKFLLNYKKSLEKYTKVKKFENINDLVEYIPDNVLMNWIVQDGIKTSQSSDDISKLKELSKHLNE